MIMERVKWVCAILGLMLVVYMFVVIPIGMCVAQEHTCAALGHGFDCFETDETCPYKAKW
jgi:hypothetical protein